MAPIKHVATANDAHAWVDLIRDIAGDPEAAHSSEDGLHVAILEAIAAGAENPVELARIALLTVNMDFSRWYA